MAIRFVEFRLIIMSKLTHLDSQDRPTMVNVGGKQATQRTAHALALVCLPPALAGLLRDGEINSKKGPVFHTAILAGIMGAKKTSELIPLCHILPLDQCSVEILPRPCSVDGSVELEVHCRVSTFGKTGVEMEALTGASIAALTLYDMGKAISKGIVLRETRLLEKTGGKSGDYQA